MRYVPILVTAVLGCLAVIVATVRELRSDRAGRYLDGQGRGNALLLTAGVVAVLAAAFAAVLIG